MTIEAVRNYSVGLKQTPKANLKSQQSFTSTPEVDEEKSNATKYMIGATALAAVIGLGLAGYNGMLGKSIQKFLGGAEKAVEKGTQNASENASSASKPLTSGTESAGSKAGDALADGAQKEAGKAGDAAKEAATNISDEINKCNEYFKKYNPNYIAFIDRNNPEQVVIINKTKGSVYDKQIFATKDFKVASNGAPPEGHKSISYAIARESDSMEKIAPNGTKTEIDRSKMANGGKRVGTTVSKGENLYYKTVTYDKNGNIINTDERVNLGDGLIERGKEGFEDAKKEVLAKLREGLNWSDEPIRKTPQA